MNKIMNLMNEINYGWVDKKGIKHLNEFDTFSDEYVLQSPDEIIKSKVGVCWDQVELERYYFMNTNNIIRTYFIVHYDNNNCPTHTFLTIEKDNKYFWFEHSWKMFRGIHEYNSLKDLLTDVKNKFIRFELNNTFIEANLQIHEYNKPDFNISVQDFYKHCENGKLIDLERI